MTAPAYDFDQAFQTKILAMALRDEPFMARVEGLIEPQYFEQGAYGYLMDFANQHYQKYRQSPSFAVLTNELRERKSKRLIKDEMLDDIKVALKDIYGEADLSNREYTVQQVEVFAQRRAVEEAIMETATRLDAGESVDDLRSILMRSLEVGAVDGLGGFDLLENLDVRTQERIDEDSGKIEKRGITTGIKQLDAELYQNGWGRGEMGLLMGGPKAGKSIGLMNFGINACRAGHNVLFVSLEVSKKIQADRMDSFMSGIDFRLVRKEPVRVKKAVKEVLAAPTSGLFKLHEYPNGSFSVSDLRRLIRKYESQSVKFDFVVVDYADIMAPETKGLEERFQMKEIYGGLRALAQEEDLALLTATQTNREGSKAKTIKKEHVAEDYNKIRLADVVLSISRPDEADKERLHLYFAAHRNGEEGFYLECVSEYRRMRFIHVVSGRGS